MKRRRYLAAVGTAAACGLAGCNAITGSDDGSELPHTIVEGPAQFTDFKIKTPKDAFVDKEVPVTVSAFNYGSETGGFSGSLITTEGAEAVSEPIELNDVKSGKRGKATVKLTFSAADEYALAVSESKVAESTSSESSSELLGVAQTSQQGTESVADYAKGKTRFTVGPKTAPVGKPLDIGTSLRVTLTEVRYQDAVYFESGSGDDMKTDLFSVPAEETLALLQFDVENTGTERATFSSESFTVPDGSMVTELHSSGLNQAEFEGNPLTDTDVKSGQKVSGWLLARLPKKRAKDGAFVGWQRDASKTLPERQWDVESTKLPSFKLDGWEVNSEQPIGEYPNKLTVKNTGKVNGKFRGIFDSKTANQSQEKWEPFEKISAAIPSGKSKTFSLRKTWTYTGPLDLRVRPFGEIKSITFHPMKISFGEEARIPGGTMSVSDFQTHSKYIEPGGAWTYKEEHTPENGARFAFVHVEYIPNRNYSGKMPSDENFSLRIEDESYPESGNLEGPMMKPINGGFYDGAFGDLQPGKPVTGWVSFDVPKSVNADNATVVLSKKYDNNLTSGAEWSKK